MSGPYNPPTYNASVPQYNYSGPNTYDYNGVTLTNPKSSSGNMFLGTPLQSMSGQNSYQSSNPYLTYNHYPTADQSSWYKGGDTPKWWQDYTTGTQTQANNSVQGSYQGNNPYTDLVYTPQSINQGHYLAWQTPPQANAHQQSYPKSTLNVAPYDANAYQLAAPSSTQTAKNWYNQYLPNSAFALNPSSLLNFQHVMTGRDNDVMPGQDDYSVWRKAILEPHPGEAPDTIPKEVAMLRNYWASGFNDWGL